MALITLENLDANNYSFYGDYQNFLRGRGLYNDKKVTVTDFKGRQATCQVFDNKQVYTIVIEAQSKKQVSSSCICSQASSGRICKHIIAAVLMLRDYVEQNAKDRWQYRLNMALENTPKQKTAREPRIKYAVLFGLQSENFGFQPIFRMFAYRIKSHDWAGVREMEQLPVEEQNQRMDSDRSWANAAENITGTLDYRSVINLPMEGVEIYNQMIMLSGGSYYGTTSFTAYLPTLARLNAPLFMLHNRNTFKKRLKVLNEGVNIEAALAYSQNHYTLQAGITLNGQVFTTVKESLQVISQNPAWLLAGEYIVPLNNPEALHLLSYFPLSIPQEDEEEFRANYFHEIADRIPIRGDVISWQDIDAEPSPRLYLQDNEKVLQAALKFGYGDEEVDANPKAEALTVRDIPDSWGMIRIHRKLEKEVSYYQLLTDAKYGLKRAGADAPGMFELRARTHPIDFLLHSIPALTQAGFEIFGERDLKLGKINRATPTISLNISSGLDWFDIDAVVKYGDQEVALQEIRRALRKNENYVKLADGSIGKIPDEWMQRYKHLFEMAEETENGLKISDLQLPLVDELLADANEMQIVPEFQERRQRLQGFEQIAHQPLPKGFTGELRPYQKAGLDWLHFLHDYQFGGCLADDMGLGKTIQVLALLQSLKERSATQLPASLLVVPKSLLANWQREAERFTPELRFLEFIGQTRKKETISFGGYDIVLTTYGTMLRDIELLRGYRFHYAILDESQAIKNPLAQVSKAARLLNAEHRLVMTGTPVENNTFELWSQFNFLNPGLLGSMDYFRKEFAATIESREEESVETATLLRKLVFPFILRRTKDQVAPELPPRTERMIYTDMEAAQRKLYNQTRDRYRGMLMGLIDTQGINDVRMKILEGLLRLRQICIHPALVEPTFTGESAKFEILLETMETLQAEKHKALIFSQFVQTLSLLRAHLDERHIPYTYLDGQTRDRQKQVDIFQNDMSIPFFLISLKAGGVGLNLTAADYVIHLDPWWNPAVEMQAADRVHRIGQDKPVFIYKFIARDSVEEKILKLQERKKELVEQLIAAEGSFFKSITKEDVQILFS